MKNQSTGMYIILAILVMVFVSSIFMTGPQTTVEELTYSAFLERLSNKEFKSVEKGDKYLMFYTGYAINHHGQFIAGVAPDTPKSWIGYAEIPCADL